ncbi:MAG: ParB/RepB/Spo0J family partition protein [Candidatus Aminicenantes bacterium]|nr:ParB/RepB/Spo0J family partition protein [Candidatus Aminicenantes bacterium]
MRTVIDVVDPKDIDFAIFNPRGEKPGDIESDPSFVQLKDSVYKYGVLVPLVVHVQSGAGKKPFRLIDGERRLRAALDTNAKKVPVRITDAGGPLGDVIQAFHIHMLRKQWNQVPQTRGLKKILKHKKWEGREKFNDEEMEELQTLTGCNKEQLRPLLRAVRYDDGVLDEVENGRLRYSHLVQIEESLVERIEAEYPSILAEIPKMTIRQTMIQKAKKNLLPGTRSLMLNVAPVISRARTLSEKKDVEGLLRKFVTNDDMTPEQVLKEFEHAHPTAQLDVLDQMGQILDAAEALDALLINFQPHGAKSWPEMARKIEASLKKLHILISSKIRGLKGTVSR